MFSQACVKNGGVCQTPPPQTRQTLPQADTPWADTPLGRHPLGRCPPPPGRYSLATAAGGTHPTGMHSCFINFLVRCIEWSVVMTRICSKHLMETHICFKACQSTVTSLRMVIKALLTVDFNVIRKWASKGKEQSVILWDISDTNSGKIIKGCDQPLITVKILRRASTRNEQSATLWDTQDISRFLHSLHLSIFRITKTVVSSIS